MAFSLQNKNRRKNPVSEINITPFVDVLLVLLIIFMISAPMLTGSVNVDLPKGASEPISQKNQPIIITIDNLGAIFLADEATKLSSLPQQLIKITGNNLEQKIYIKADKSLDYGRVMDVIKNINQSGFSNVILATQIAQ